MKLESEKEVMDAIQLLGWKDISTRRQMNNGTIIYELPILKYGNKIQIGSFQSGYVRRMNGCYTPYQLNKCENYDHFYKAYEWCTKNDGNGDYGKQKWTGKYNKHVCKRRIIIPGEVARLRYLVLYCLKNYYINQANMIENGNYITKWRHEYEMQNGNIDKIRELQNEVMKYERTVRELHEEIDRISGKCGQLNNLSITVNDRFFTLKEIK